MLSLPHRLKENLLAGLQFESKNEIFKFSHEDGLLIILHGPAHKKRFIVLSYDSKKTLQDRNMFLRIAQTEKFKIAFSELLPITIDGIEQKTYKYVNYYLEIEDGDETFTSHLAVGESATIINSKFIRISVQGMFHWGHRFQWETFSPRMCAYCVTRKMMKGNRCEICDTTVHRQCVTHFEGMCGTEKTDAADETIGKEREEESTRVRIMPTRRARTPISYNEGASSSRVRDSERKKREESKRTGRRRVVSLAE